MPSDQQARTEVFDFLHRLEWPLNEANDIASFASATQRFLQTFRIPGTQNYTIQSPASEYNGAIQTSFKHAYNITPQEFVNDIYHIYFEIPLTLADLAEIIRENPDTFYEAAEEYRRPYADLWDEIQLGGEVYRYQLFPGSITIGEITEIKPGLYQVDLDY